MTILSKTLNKDYFNNIDTEEKAYWLGFLCADGSILWSNNRNTHKHLVLDLSSKDKEHLCKFATIFGVQINDYCHIHDKYNKVYYSSKVNVCGLEIERLENYMENPEIFLESSDSDLIRHFVRGYFDGNGCVMIHNYKTQKPSLVIDFTTHNYELLILLRNIICINSDIHGGSIFKGSGNCHHLRFTGSKQSIKICYWMYNQATIYLNRKYEIYYNFDKSYTGVIL